MNEQETPQPKKITEIVLPIQIISQLFEFASRAPLTRTEWRNLELWEKQIQQGILEAEKTPAASPPGEIEKVPAGQGPQSNPHNGHYNDRQNGHYNGRRNGKHK